MTNRKTLYKSVHRYIQGLALGAASVAMTSGAALAQAPAGATDDGSTLELEEILVTGTLIRGVEAAGSKIIGLDAQAILETGAVTTNELLATIPQVSNFFNRRPEQDPRGAGGLQVNRPNLRNLPGINAATGATTLLLMDGHRITPVGTDQASPDPDVIPTAVMQRVEVVTDGGSSLYGADAVGGVINFTTLDEFDGVKVDLGYDMGDDYDGWQASVVAGTSWTDGSGYVALATTDRDSVLTEDRDWAAQGTWNEDGSVLTPDGTECLQPVGAVTTWFWFGAGWTDNPLAPGAGVTPVGEPCDVKGKAALLPEQQRDNFYAGITQSLSDSLTLKVKAYYMDRSTNYSRYPTGDTVAEPTPTELGLTGDNIGDLVSTSQVGFSFGTHPDYRSRDLEIGIETWGITPELTIDLPNSWQINTLLHYGQSDNRVSDPQTDRTKLVDYVANGDLDPLNVAAADTAVVQDILNWQVLDEVEQELLDIRAIADGDVFELPAGMLKAAVGVEYARDEASKRSGETTFGGAGALNEVSGNRDVTSAFAELSVPILDSLDLSLSIRYDDYSDFGDTTNPGMGITYEPFEWITLFGKWGESFNAPTVLDSIVTGNGRYIFNAAAGVPDPLGERTNPSRDDVLVLEGASGTLEPQTAETWGVGFELRPLEGLSVETYYYEIEFRQLLGAVNPQRSEAVLLNPDKFIFEPTQAEWDAILASIENGNQYADIDATEVGVVVDRRIANTEEALLKGIDFAVRYTHDTSFGVMSYGLSGNYQTDFVLTQSGTEVDQLNYNPDLFVSADIGWARDALQARLNFRYTDEYDADPTLAVNQSKVDDFLVTNLFVGYQFQADSGFMDGLSLSLNVDNLFDEDPSAYRQQSNLSYSEWSWTLGRVFKFGISKHF
ncbi:TonB-dependent receptor [Mangrovimicrobium sediminis]|uniref:TonB-dependent receptor n=1 Tax=Mangrovimicrobium sediminis TaxID=2562682 RepID=A0A4Z0LWW8_9GAMM|nr:TonB-dependent receptor [Haliea sp. SAOS-164]TGD71730.1 TonB-dependent receptor [Haliea sp. SAOS-164]